MSQEKKATHTEEIAATIQHFCPNGLHETLKGRATQHLQNNVIHAAIRQGRLTMIPPTATYNYCEYSSYNNLLSWNDNECYTITQRLHEGGKTATFFFLYSDLLEPVKLLGWSHTEYGRHIRHLNNDIIKQLYQAEIQFLTSAQLEGWPDETFEKVNTRLQNERINELCLKGKITATQLAGWNNSKYIQITQRLAPPVIQHICLYTTKTFEQLTTWNDTQYERVKLRLQCEQTKELCLKKPPTITVEQLANWNDTQYQLAVSHHVQASIGNNTASLMASRTEHPLLSPFSRKGSGTGFISRKNSMSGGGGRSLVFP